MNRYVKVKKQNFVYLVVCSLIFSLVVTSLFFVGYTVFSKLEKDVYVFLGKESQLSQPQKIVLKTLWNVSGVFRNKQRNNKRRK